MLRRLCEILIHVSWSVFRLLFSCCVFLFIIQVSGNKNLRILFVNRIILAEETTISYAANVQLYIPYNVLASVNEIQYPLVTSSVTILKAISSAFKRISFTINANNAVSHFHKFAFCQHRNAISLFLNCSTTYIDIYIYHVFTLLLWSKQHFAI